MIKKFTESVVCSMAYDIDSHKFSIRLKTLRKENKMTQDALAQKLAITQTQISRYESGTDRNSPEARRHLPCNTGIYAWGSGC